MANLRQRALQRRKIREVLNDSWLADNDAPRIERQLLRMYAGATEPMVAQAMACNNHEQLAATLANQLETNEGMDGDTVRSGEFLDLLVEVFKKLIPALMGCFAASPTGARPTAAQVLAAIKAL